MLREEDILKMRQQGMEEKYNSIYSSHLFINRQHMEFAMEDIYPPMVGIMLPKSFVDMPMAIAKQKYPSEYRPTVIKTSPDLSINFAFQYFEQAIQEEEIGKTARYYYGILQKCYSGYGFLGFEEGYRKNKEEHALAWYVYRNPTLTDTVLNIHAFTAVEGRLLQGIFNAPEAAFFHWQPYAVEVFQSIVSKRSMEGSK